MRARMSQSAVVDKKILAEKIKNYHNSSVPSCCLCCDGELITGKWILCELDRGRCLITCSQCGAKWYENYRFTGLSPI
jgi:hypothetical protein